MHGGNHLEGPKAEAVDPGRAGVQTCDLTFWYPGAAADAPAVADVNLLVCEGERVLLCGPSGSGKSTLLRLLLGLAPQLTGGRLAGEIEVLGLDPTTTPPRAMAAGGVGLLFQNPTEGFVSQRVEGEVAFGLENLGIEPAEIEARITEGLAAVGLSGFERRRTHELSAGQQQRVALAAALALRPRLLLLDEPTAHLDPASAREIIDLVGRVQAETGAALILSEHRLGLAAPMVDRAIVLAAGRVVADGPPRHVFADPRLPGMGVPVPRSTQVAVALRIGEPMPLTPEELAERIVSLPLPWGEGGGEGVLEVSGRAPARVGDPSPGLRPASPPGEANLSSGGVTAHGALSEPALVYQGVSFAYSGASAPALQGVSLSLLPGEVMALVGPSGAGKSTLARLALGLLRPHTGRVELAGFDTARTPVRQLARLGGLVLQNPLQQLLAESVEDELRLGLRELPPAQSSQRVEHLLQTFGLGDLRKRHPLALSEGQRRRVALAATLARRPRVLVLDEPTLGQDEAQRTALQSLVRALAADGTAVLAISHDPEFVNDAADRAIALEAGRVVADSPMSDAYAAPQRLRAAGVPLGDVPATALALGQHGHRIHARFAPELVSALGG